MDIITFKSNMQKSVEDFLKNVFHLLVYRVR